MRVVLQRVSRAAVHVEGEPSRSIGRGFLILLGIEDADEAEDLDWLVRKVAGLRVFSDTEGKMNLDIREAAGSFLVISQFTLHASTRKGNRPSFIKAARPEKALPLYESFCRRLADETALAVHTGSFGADMQVELVNDGPVTILIDSKNRE